MKLREIFRFELAYQFRRPATWIYFAVLFMVAWNSIQGNYIFDARDGWFQVNSPGVIFMTMVLGCWLWLFIAAGVAGDAGARDVESGMHPLVYSAPLGKSSYLAGRFLAAYAINAVLLLAVPAGMFLGMNWPRVEPEILGPWRPEAFALAYLLIGLPNAFAATAVQFCFATLGRRAISAYLGSVVLFFASMGLAAFAAVALDRQDLARLVDPIGMIFILNELSDTWTTAQMNTRLIGLQPPLLLPNRLLWTLIGLGVLAFTWRRFRFVHPGEGARKPRRKQSKTLGFEPEGVPHAQFVLPAVQRRFSFATHLRQALDVAWQSFKAITFSRAGLVPLALAAFLLTVAIPANMDHLGVPLVPRTEHMLGFLTSALVGPAHRAWMILPLLIVFYAGELIWRERNGGMSEITGASPTPEWSMLLGKFLGLALLLVVWMAMLVAVGALAQTLMGYPKLELGLYLRVMFGLQLIDYLLFALLALFVHVAVNHKQLGYLAALLLYGLISFAPMLGIEHKLLVYGSDTGWSYSDIRGFGPGLVPWLWFKAYWIAWALLLAVGARLAWVRGRETGLAARLQLARRRLTPPTLAFASLAGALVLGIGGYIFYNTNVLNDYRGAAARAEGAAEYERRFRRYADVAQPDLAASKLRVELYPERRSVEIRGSYRLTNRTQEAIATLHVATAPSEETRSMRLDRPAKLVQADDELGHRIYALASPLRPGESMQLEFQVRSEPNGFSNRGVDEAVVANGSWVQTANRLPAIGYQPSRELRESGDRRRFALRERPTVPPLEDLKARNLRAHGIEFEAIVGTAEGQVAVAPGALRRSWSERGRRYFHYVSSAPIGEEPQFFSARYAVRELKWQGVTIQVYHHPSHTQLVQRMARSARASLEVYTRLYGPYPYDTLRLVENSERGIGAHSEPSLIDYGDGFALLDPATNPEGLDLVFAVTAHEVGHQWWGGRGLPPAPVEGVGFLIESMATWSAMQVVEESLGAAQLQRYLDMMRKEYSVPRSRAAKPLLRATEQFLNYRKGPLAMYALGQYIGKDRVNAALRKVIDKHGPDTFPRPTSLDLYRELQAVTPAMHRQLLHDLLAANTWWELSTEQAVARNTAAGTWEVRMDVGLRKLVVDEDGEETLMPPDEWVEIGVYPGPTRKTEDGQVIAGKPLYLEKHRIRSGKQTITVTVAEKPGHVGIDPRTLLIDLRSRDNYKDISPPR